MVFGLKMPPSQTTKWDWSSTIHSLRRLQDYITVSLYFHLEALLVLYLTWRVLETRPFLGPMTTEQREYERSLEETSGQFRNYAQLTQYLWYLCLLASGSEILTQQWFLYSVSKTRPDKVNSSGAPLHGMTASICGVPLVAFCIAKLLVCSKLVGRYSHTSDSVIEGFSDSNSLDSTLLVLQSLLLSSISYLCYIVLSKIAISSKFVSSWTSVLITLVFTVVLNYDREVLTCLTTIVFSEVATLVAIKLDSLSGTIGAISWKEAVIISQGIFSGLVLGGSVLWRSLVQNAYAHVTALLSNGLYNADSLVATAGSFSEMPRVTATFQIGSVLFIALTLPFIPSSVPNKQRQTTVLLWIGSLVCAVLIQLAMINAIVYTDPFQWVFFFLTSSWWRIGLISYWAIWLLIMVELLSPGTRYGEYLRGHVPNIVIRKVFHVVAVAMFVPGIIMEHRCMQLAFVVAFQGLVTLELLRILGYGQSIHAFMSQFTDIRDEGFVILTHLYLLLGCALPVWLTATAIACFQEPASVDAHGGNSLPWASAAVWASIASSAGILSLGIGDAAAAMVGSLAGKSKWMNFVSECGESLKKLVPSSIGRKSVEGTMASLLSILFASSSLINAADMRVFLRQDTTVLGVCDQTSHTCQYAMSATTDTTYLPLRSLAEGGTQNYRYILLEYSAWLALYETFTNCIDNLVMPLYAWTACILLL